jgi:hypothetical protein
MRYELLTPLLAFGLFLGMLALLEAGRRLGVRWQRADPEGAHDGTRAVEGAVFGLLGLLVAFSFSGAMIRFDARRHMIVEEANAIATAYLRVEALPPEAQPALRTLFRRYLDARLSAYEKLPDLTAARAELARATTIQGELWTQAVASTRATEAQASGRFLLSALSNMFEIATRRTMATQLHPPLVVFALLFALGLGCSVLAGYGMARGQKRKWPHMIAFAAVTSLTVYLILNLEYPRLGLIRVDAFDQVLIEVRERMQ